MTREGADTRNDRPGRGREPDHDDALDDALRALAEPPADVPPPSGALESALADLEPVRMRTPARAAGLAGAVSIVYALVLVTALSVRRDLAGLPTWWMSAFLVAWLSSFTALGWLALVPARGHVMPRWRVAAGLSVLAGIGFVAAGLAFARHVPGESLLSPPGLASLWEHGKDCIAWALITAVVPVVMGALLIRGTVPVGSRWIGAALGAAGGSLGGFMLHLHCDIADAAHVGVIHGGAVILSAIIGAVIIPRVTG